MSRKATTLSSCNFRFQKLVRKEETETRERERERERERRTEWRIVLELDLVAILQKTHEAVAPMAPAIILT
jgi:hypothetical protein